VFDANLRDSRESLGGKPLTILTFFADTPRALAVTPDGARVYAASFFSGNGTAAPFAGTLMNLQNPLPPFKIFDFFPLNRWQPQPITGVKYDGTAGRMKAGSIAIGMMFTLPDRTCSRSALPARRDREWVRDLYMSGTTLFNMIVNPANGKLFEPRVK
jgi:hypothetical protein